MKNIFLLFAFTILSNGFAQENYTFHKVLNQDSLKNDFEILWQTLNEIHPALYKFQQKAALKSLYDVKQSSIGRDLTQFEFYLLIKSFVDAIHCTHTDAQEPDGYHANWLLKSCKVLPFDVFIKNNRCFIQQVFSNDINLLPGSEIVAINGLPFPKVLDSLFQYVRGDANLRSWKEYWVSGPQFKYQYSEYFQYSGTYTLQLRNPVSRAVEITQVKGLTHLESEHYRDSVRNSIVLPVKKPLELMIAEDSSFAVLSISSFHFPKIIAAGQNYEKFLAGAFKTIESNKVKNLVIDIRNNNGGYTGNALRLFAYLSELPFDVVDYAEVKAINPLPRRNLLEPKMPVSTHPGYVHSLRSGLMVTEFPAGKKLIVEQKIARKNRFNGPLYVLINGGTASASSYFTYAVKMYQRGVFIGEEQGANVNGCPGWDEVTLKLPYSGLKIIIPLVSVHFVPVPGLVQGHGMKPDFLITESIEDYVNGKDRCLEFAKKMILEKK